MTSRPPILTSQNFILVRDLTLLSVAVTTLDQSTTFDCLRHASGIEL